MVDSAARLLSRKEAAAVLGLTPLTLGKPYWTKNGPPFVRLSANRTGYPRDELQAWIDARPKGGRSVNVTTNQVAA